MSISTFILSRRCPGRLPNGDGQGDSRLVQIRIWIWMISGLFLCLLPWPPPPLPRGPGRSLRLGHRRTLSLKDPWRFPIFWILIRSSTDRFRTWLCSTLHASLPVPECQWGGVSTRKCRVRRVGRVAGFGAFGQMRFNMVCQFLLDSPACNTHSWDRHPLYRLPLPAPPRSVMQKLAVWLLVRVLPLALPYAGAQQEMVMAAPVHAAPIMWATPG
jgi:hypothetical protein